MVPKFGEHFEGVGINARKLAVLIPVLFIGLYFYLGVIIWDALLSSFSSVSGGVESMSLFAFILWVGFGFLVCYLLGLLTIAILRNKKSEK
jgi:hypothetical protein